MTFMRIFLTLLYRTLINLHPVIKMGAIGFGLSVAANYYILFATPPALWNSPHSIVEQKAVLGLRVVSIVLYTIGWGLHLYREAKIARGHRTGAV